MKILFCLMKVVFYEDFMRRNVGCIISFQNQSTGENHLFPDCKNLKVTTLIAVSKAFKKSVTNVTLALTPPSLSHSALGS